MILLRLHVAERQIGAASHLDFLDELDGLLLGRDERRILSLEEHLHGQQGLVVVCNTFFVFLLLHA